MGSIAGNAFAVALFEPLQTPRPLKGAHDGGCGGGIPVLGILLRCRRAPAGISEARSEPFSGFDPDDYSASGKMALVCGRDPTALVYPALRSRVGNASGTLLSRLPLRIRCQGGIWIIIWEWQLEWIVWWSRQGTYIVWSDRIVLARCRGSPSIGSKFQVTRAGRPDGFIALRGCGVRSPHLHSRK